MTAKEARDHPCTCHPDDKPPKPCPKKYAYSECVSHAAGVAEGMAKAAEIARAYGAAERRCAIESTREAVIAEGSAQYRAATRIAEAILARRDK